MKTIVQTSFANANQGESHIGSLYLVATPIGNLEDMTFRAIRTLRECDIIAAEDTRQTRKLLTHFDIQTKQLFSYHEHNKAASGPEIIRYIIEGKNVALVSDAGLPAISDPGTDLVRLAIAEGIPVIPIPGANAALSALIASGLPTDRFTFIGFLPRERKDVMEQLQGLGAASGTLIFYESPHRVKRTLELLKEGLGDRKMTLARELTKRYEEFVRGTVTECQEWLEEHPPLGEYCIVVEGASYEDELREQNAWWQELSLEEHVARYEQQGLGRKDAMKRTANDRGVSKRDIYNSLL